MRIGIGLTSRGTIHLTDPISTVHKTGTTDVIALTAVQKAAVAKANANVTHAGAPLPITHVDTQTGLSTPPLTQTTPPVNSSTVTAATQPASTTVRPSFMDGVTAWSSPSNAIAIIENFLADPAGMPGELIIGVVAVPIALIVGGYALMSKKGR